MATQLQNEIERLENIFSVYRPQSILSRWKSSATPATLIALDNPELCEVLALAEQWYSHVIDPRTGRPVDQVASASVHAPNTATADAIATMLSVVEPAEGLAFMLTLADSSAFASESLGCLIVDKTGYQFTNDVWDRLTQT